MSDKVMVSIVTVSYNAEQTITKTINSVLAQTYKNFEYIIKDGNSNDKTNEIIRQYEKAFKENGLQFKHIIGVDDGIYSAMNQALDYCVGEWIMFLNADDELYSDNVLSKVFENISDYRGDIVYGDADFVDDDTHFLWKGNIDIIENKCPYCHQSSFVKRNWMITHKFDETLKITADYDFMYKSYSEKAVFVYVPFIICRFYRGGASGTKLVQDRIEHHSVQLRYNTFVGKNKLKFQLAYLWAIVNAWIQEKMFSILPEKVSASIRHFRRKRRMEIIE